MVELEQYEKQSLFRLKSVDGVNIYQILNDTKISTCLQSISLMNKYLNELFLNNKFFDLYYNKNTNFTTNIDINDE